MSRIVRAVEPPLKVSLLIPFGVKGWNILMRRCKNEKISPEKALLDEVINQLMRRNYTEEDVEQVLEKDNLSDQVTTWVEKNRRMLSFGKGGVYGTLKFSVSPREILEVKT